MISKKFRTALLLSVFISAGASAQQFDTGLTRQNVEADLAAWKQAGLDQLSRGELGPDTFSPQYRQAYEGYLQHRPGSDYRASTPLTSAQVKADLAMWKQAGMDKFDRGDLGVDTQSREYRLAYDNYRRLRDGEQYQGRTGLTRDEVQADLKAWRDAGMMRFWAGDRTPDTFSFAYRSAFDYYEQLRPKG
ncbi:DUF4148 domain-containing protein [Castellaniella sp.]|uniref:DUF4148 domain-containing protein n=1 Tax=Castellaniella sp. TaxID=1955812 RepID=UPI003A8EB7A9